MPTRATIRPTPIANARSILALITHGSARPSNDPTSRCFGPSRTTPFRRWWEHPRHPPASPAPTGAPPRGGWGGGVRRTAFRYSGSDWAQWLMLLGADRVNVVEGLLADLARGR